MLIRQTIFTALALFDLTNASFFYYPKYRCIEDHTCIESRGVDGDVVGRSSDMSFELVQRLPKDDLPRDVQIRQLAQHLARKYDRGTPVARSGDVVRRSNTYPIVSAAVPTQTNSAGIDQDGTDFSYFAQVLLGSNSTPLYMLLDTGAATTWVMGPSCSSAPCKVHNSFGAGDSSTFQPTTTSFSIAYGSGAVSGMYGKDSLTLAGITLTMEIGIANVTSSDFNNFPIDGLLGLARADSTTPTFLNALVASKALKSNIFGISLNRNSDGPNTGEINFGAPDPSKYNGNLNYIGVSPSSTLGDWAIPLDNAGAGANEAGITGELAYIDTGTSYIFCPPASCSTFYAQIPGAILTSDNETWTVPCTTTISLTFTFGGTAYTVSPKDWVGPMVNGVCTSNVFGHVVVAGAWLLGDTFLKNVYTVFDVDQNRIGFAQKISVVPVTSTATNPSATAVNGGPNSLSDSITPSMALSSSNTVLITGSMSSMEPSNRTPTGISSARSTATSKAATPTSNPTSQSGASTSLHETSSSGTAAAETTSPSPSPAPSKSSATHYGTDLLNAALAVAALITLIL